MNAAGQHDPRQSQVHEEIIFTGNIGPMAKGTPAYAKAEESLRRLAAKMNATKGEPRNLRILCYLNPEGN